MKIRMETTLLRQQRGVAAIMFVIMLPVLMGFISLGIEGGRYLALKGQFRDAAEVASLAISARGSDNLADNQKLAEAVIRSMIPDAGKIVVKVEHKDCQANEGCGGSDNGRFDQYQISIDSTQNSWFPDWTGDGMGFPEEMNMSMDATARKYYGSGGIDVVFVADFSGSMNCKWGEESCGKDNDKNKGNGNNEKTKIEFLKETIKDIAIKLEGYSATQQNANTMALVPFTGHTRKKKNGDKYFAVKQVEGKIVYGADAPKPVFDIETAFNNIFKVKKNYIAVSDLGSNNDKDGIFHTIPLINTARQLYNPLEKMQAGGWTASFEGIIRAAQIAKKGTNQFRLIVILSDGQDKGPTGYHAKANITAHTDLLEKSYCDKIRTELNSLEIEGRPVQSRIAVIGIGYDAENDPNLSDCAGPGNVFTAKSMDEVNELLLELVSNSEEVGHLYFDSGKSEFVPE